MCLFQNQIRKINFFSVFDVLRKIASTFKLEKKWTFKGNKCQKTCPSGM